MPLTSLVHTETDDENVIQGYRVSSVVLDVKTSVQHVVIYNTPAYGKVLVLDGSTQSAQHDEHVYHESLVHPAMSQCSHAKRVLILGGGESGTSREVLRYTSVEHVSMVDFDGDLMNICRDMLPEWSTAPDGTSTWDDPRLHVHAADAFGWLEARRDTPDGHFDVIIMDLCDPNVLDPSDQINRFYTPDFFATLRSHHLNDGGVLLVQAGDYTLYHPVAHAIYGTFACNTYAVYIPSFASQWVFILAFKDSDATIHYNDGYRTLPRGLRHMTPARVKSLLCADFHTDGKYPAVRT